MPSAVEIRDLVKRFGSFVAVDHINLEVGRGEIFGFLGPNGAGKSTTIRMLCGLLQPTSGKATVGGLPAMTLTYSPTKDVERRFYFVVRNDKVYRITMDWFKPQRADYLAAYDRVIASFKFR